MILQAPGLHTYTINKTPGGFSFESPQAQPDTTQDAQDHTEDGGENLAANECHGHLAPLG